MCVNVDSKRKTVESLEVRLRQKTVVGGRRLREEKDQENSERKEKTREKGIKNFKRRGSPPFQNTQSHPTTVLSAAKHSGWKLSKGYRDKKQSICIYV